MFYVKKNIIVVYKREDDYEATFFNTEEWCAPGRTVSEAVGNLVRQYPKGFNLIVGHGVGSVVVEPSNDKVDLLHKVYNKYSRCSDWEYAG